VSILCISISAENFADTFLTKLNAKPTDCNVYGICVFSNVHLRDNFLHRYLTSIFVLSATSGRC
jgi:L-amino acid N-acyltransferase YncA